ncbi:MAG TPA: GatB/YqeY domain-containing protein [Thiotrichaceae bacterium]|jgi:uncharacterized protein YqeY|nr:GatB/YqeY domain-containing protein [Thiotrichaceae bacterium]HIM07888.1 GatB/YqeY domain-containing protein [Gammaproteobacteria bacterium]
MADIKNKLSDDVKAAMRAKEKKLLAALRMIQAAFKQKEIDDRIELTDEHMVVILDKMAKQHRDSISQFKDAKRDDLVEIEEYELDIITTYLPAQLSDDEIKSLIDNAISKTGAESIKDMGKVMGILKGELQGRADMGKVSGLIKVQLN